MARQTVRLLCLALLAFVVAVAGCGNEAVLSKQELTRESPRFRVVSTADLASDAEMDRVIERAEALFDAISDYVGPQTTPAAPINIMLEGDIVDSGSRLDFDGIHLVRYRASDGGYLATLAHELVHAFGAPWFIEHGAWDWPTYRFFDEGFAEFLAQRVDPDKTGFPFFDLPEDAVVGRWVERGSAIPLAELRARHDELSDRCNLQAYTLRASWFRHMEERHGSAAVLAVVYPDREPVDEVVREATGHSLAELDAQWEAWLRARYEVRTDADSIWETYRERTPWYTPCEEGVHW